jgi:hypothetical protein
LTICACLSLEMTLNVGLDISFNTMYDWEGIRKNAGEVNSMETSLTNDVLPAES